MATTNDMFKADLNVEIMLQINQRLWERAAGAIAVYEEASARISSRHPEVEKLPGVSILRT